MVISRIARVAELLVIVVALAWAASGPLGAQSILPRHACLTAEQRDILSHLSIEYLDDGFGGQMKTIRVTGANVQIVNGIGVTDSSNGLGNLIVGYQELGNEIEPDDRTGSHYVAVGRRHNYKRFGGIVVGESNVAGGDYAGVHGGRRNRADGNWSAVSGGGYNAATADQSAAFGGSFNWAAAGSSVVLGGSGNQARAAGNGGAGNESVVVGGFDIRSMGQASVVVGGRYNETSANYSAILAGVSNECLGDPNGGGSFCSIVGGEGNVTGIATAATVGGGLGRTAAGDHDFVAGSLFEDQ